MSSRNVYLNPEQRKSAPVLYKSLLLAKRLYAEGKKDTEKIRGEMAALIRKEPLANIEYISIANPATLEELQTIKKTALVSLAVKYGNTRLIDNMMLGE
jgi:pantoate--beta-alanine ligase